MLLNPDVFNDNFYLKLWALILNESPEHKKLPFYAVANKLMTEQHRKEIKIPYLSGRLLHPYTGIGLFLFCLFVIGIIPAFFVVLFYIWLDSLKYKPISKEVLGEAAQFLFDEEENKLAQLLDYLNVHKLVLSPMILAKLAQNMKEDDK